VAHGGVFQLYRADPFPAGLDHVLGAVGDLQSAVRVEDRHVAGVEPAIAIHRIGLGLEIALDHPGASHLQGPCGLAIARQHLRRITQVDAAHLHPERRAALLGLERHLRLEIQAVPVPRLTPAVPMGRFRSCPRRG
jgi:hypothetical protein